MDGLELRQREQLAAHRAARAALHTPRQDGRDGKAGLADLQAEKAGLQEAAEQMQASMAATSQVRHSVHDDSC